MDNTNQMEARGDSQDSPLSVSQLNWVIKNLLENSLSSLWAEGEISDLSRPRSGHIYFTLKDDRSQVRAVIWRSAAQKLKFQLKDGLQVICRGAVEVYPPRGSYQLIISAVQPQGVGPLQIAFQQLHAKLSAEGLFDPAGKQALPRFPKRIGFVTSQTGAAIHDFLEAASQLWNDIELFVIPARVQGEQASADIVAGIQRAQQLRPKLDLLIVGRGGGSIEDLWSFNEEAVVRAIASCSLPTISAVGHEIDVTLSDLAADARALTPSHAAQLSLPSQQEISSSLVQLRRRADKSVSNRIQLAKNRLQSLASLGVLARPHDIHRIRRQQVDELELRVRSNMQQLIAAGRDQVASLARATEALSPLNVLARGYSLSRDAQTLKSLRSVDDASIGQTLETLLPDGSLVCQVQEKRKKGSHEN